MSKSNGGPGDTYDIMVVEDNAVNALHLTTVLEKAGYSVRSAGNGKLALRSIKARQPVLIILDVIMEGMDGYEVCRLLKDDENTRHIPIIFITALNGKEDVLKSFQAGGVDFITKPFNNEELIARINTQMGMCRLKLKLENENRKLESEIIERKLAEEAVHIYQDIVNEMSIGLHVYHLENIDDDTTLRMISINSAAELFTGVSGKDAIGKTLDENFPGLRKQGVPQLYAEVVRSGKPLELGDILYGDERIEKNWFSVRAFSLPGNCLGITFDRITDRKLAEDKLQESERLLNTTGNIAKVGGWKFDTDSQQLSWTEEVYRIHEVDRSFIPDVDKGVSFYHPESRPHIVKAIQRAIDNGEPFDMELKFITARGNHRWVRSKGEAIRVDGKTIEISGIFQDITERIEIEQKNRSLSTAVEQSPNSIMITDLDGNIEYVNPYFTQLTGYTFEEAMGKPVSILESGEMSPAHYQKMWEKILSGQMWRGEFHNKKKNGELFWELASVTGIKNDQGEIINFLAIKEDITERKLIEEELQEKLDELKRWKNITLGRETRVLELKSEVNDLLARSGEPARYVSVEGEK